MTTMPSFSALSLFLIIYLSVPKAFSFSITPLRTASVPFSSPSSSSSSRAPRRVSTQLHFFDKVFEETGPLGKGITVGKVQVALSCPDRSSGSILGILKSKAGASASSNAQLASLANEVCLALLRKSDDWTGACSSGQWFSQKNAGKAESLFNDWANREAAKFEKVCTWSGVDKLIVSVNPWLISRQPKALLSDQRSDFAFGCVFV